MISVNQLTHEIQEEMIALREHLHRNPELSLQEFETANLVEENLRKNVKFQDLHRVGKTGLCLTIKGSKGESDRCIAFRGDMDALPVLEDKGFALRSTRDGVMHACGHDVHTSVALGAARVLSACQDQFAGTAMFFFQPAEETLQGATLFLQDPAIDFSKIQAVVGIHVSPEFEAGKIGVRNGPILASADSLKITVRGKGGHGAHPHTVHDPVVALASIILNLQTIVSREINPADSAVLSICQLAAGTAHNIVPNEAIAIGTARALTPGSRDRVETSLSRIAKEIALALSCEADVQYTRGVPPLLNSPEWIERSVRVAQQLMGNESVVTMPYASMGGDDFAFLKEGREGCFLRLGARSPGGAYGSMHSSTFYCDSLAIPTGIKALAGVALDYFEEAYC